MQFSFREFRRADVFNNGISDDDYILFRFSKSHPVTSRFSCLICFNLASICSAIHRVMYRFSCWICFNPVSNGSAIINMTIGSRLYNVNVNYTSEMIFVALVIVYGDKAILQIEIVIFVYIVLCRINVNWTSGMKLFAFVAQFIV